MDCCCEMECEETAPEEPIVSAAVTLLEEKYRRAMNFGTYLEQHPTLSESDLGMELRRATTMYRLAINSVLDDLKKPPAKVRVKK